MLASTGRAIRSWREENRQVGTESGRAHSRLP
jgi:hypothetical protein